VRVQRFLRTPKGVALLLILAIAMVAATLTGGARPWTILLVASLSAGAVDLIALRVRRRRWVFPDGALITGLLIGMILTPVTSISVTAATSVIAIASKYVVRAGRANVFNPAALALVVSFIVFHTGQSWWGALPEAGPRGLILLFAAGVIMLREVNKIPVALTFLGVYYALITAVSFLSDPAGVAHMYREPELQASLFFAFFMVSDPPTCPTSTRDQLIFACIVGAASVAAYEFIGAAYYLSAGLLVGNIWEAVRRRRERSMRVALDASTLQTQQPSVSDRTSSSDRD
jgi:Na+-translocating ferredoxin:NAD+ oxidoreductase RnfD subunit